MWPSTATAVRAGSRCNWRGQSSHKCPRFPPICQDFCLGLGPTRLFSVAQRQLAFPLVTNINHRCLQSAWSKFNQTYRHGFAPYQHSTKPKNHDKIGDNNVGKVCCVPHIITYTANILPAYAPIHLPISFDRVRGVPEIRHHYRDVPFILVATQIDLRNESEAAEKLASQNR
ncbi:hypothetical protein C8R45DRAFT_986582 [Mycena sanguinolenta]|nr:hypothetical protein C8R45DRAFT_986582 [Mycena sanguinolenta]